jgi:hypothetical protein
VLRGEMEYTDGYFVGIYSLTPYEAEDRYYCVLVTVSDASRPSTLRMYNVMDLDTRERT